MRLVARVLLALVLSFVLCFLFYLSNDDMFVAGGSNSSTMIYRHAMESRIGALVLSVILVCGSVFSRNAGIAARALVVGLATVILLVSLHTLLFSDKDQNFRELYGPFVTHSIALNSKSEKPIEFEPYRFLTVFKNELGSEVWVLNWFTPWRFDLDVIASDGLAVKSVPAPMAPEEPPGHSPGT